MKKVQFHTEYTEYNSIAELPANDRELAEASVKAWGNAYAPYSNFQVGAAVRLHDEQIVLGNNQENAAYPSGLCAERVAIFAASALNPNTIVEAVAIYAEHAGTDHNQILSPCGGCRQVLAEYEFRQNKPIRIILCSGKGKILVFDGIQQLLPLAFRPSFLLNKINT